MRRFRSFLNIYGTSSGLLVVMVLLTGSLFYVVFGQNINFGTQNSNVDVKIAGVVPGPITSQIQGSGPCAADGSIDQEESNFVNELNQYRASKGLGPLNISPKLSNMADWLANDMATKNYFTHTDSLGRGPNQTQNGTGSRGIDCGIPSPDPSEVAGSGSADGHSALIQLENSPEHNAILLDNDGIHNQIGVARRYNANSSYKWYWVADLGTNDDSSSYPPGGETGTGTGTGSTGGVCGTLCSGTCDHGGIVVDGPGGTDIEPDFTGQCGQAYYGTDNQWYACTSDKTHYQNGWVPVAAGSCLNGDIIDHITGACITNEFIGSPNASDASNKVCGSNKKEYQCQNGAWNPTGNSCGPNSGGTGTGTGIGTGTGTGGGGTGGTYSLTLNADKPSYAPGGTLLLCYTITPNTPFQGTLVETIQGLGSQNVGNWSATGTPGECIKLVIDQNASSGAHQFTANAAVNGQQVATASTTVQITGSNTLPTQPVATSSPVLSPTLPATTTPILSPTITIAPTGITATTNPTTTPSVGTGNLAFNIEIPGIGTNTGGGANNNPAPSSVNLQIQLLDPTTLQAINTISTILNYNQTNGKFTGSAQIPNGTYLLKVRSANSLWNNIGPVILSAGQNATAPDATLITGDLNQDNVLDLADYNIFISCYADRACSQKPTADVNQDGKVNNLDLNIFYSGLANRQGD